MVIKAVVFLLFLFSVLPLFCVLKESVKLDGMSIILILVDILCVRVWIPCGRKNTEFRVLCFVCFCRSNWWWNGTVDIEKGAVYCFE